MTTDAKPPGRESAPDRQETTSAATSRKAAFLASLLSGLRLLSRREMKGAIALTAGMVVGSFLEMLSVAAVLPFVNIVIQPDSLQTNEFLGRMYRLAGMPALPHLVVLLGVTVIVLTVICTMTNWVLQYALHRYAASCQNRLAKDLLDQCIHAPYSWFLTRNYTTLARLIYEDVVFWSRSLVQRVMTMINDGITLGMALALVLIVSPWTGVAAMTAVGLLAYVGFNLTRPFLIRLAATKRQALDTTALAVTQALAGIKDIKLSSREAHFTKLFQSAYATVTGSHARLNAWQVIPSMTMMMLGQVTLVAIALTFWHMGIESGQIATQLALLIIVMAKVIPTVSSLSSAFGNLWNAFPYVAGIHGLRESILAEAKRVSRTEALVKTSVNHWRRITFEGTGFQYPNSQDWALKELNISLERGAVYGIVGRSAAGKSTLVDLLVGLLEPTEGQLRVDGNPLQDLELKSWQRRIGYVPQVPFVLDDTLRANVAFGVPRGEVNDAWVLECLRLANLGGLLDELEQGLDGRLGDRGMRLSGGQRQRVAIARALYNQPELVVFDEATSALDSISESEILAALENLRGRMTLIIIAHRLTTVAHCDQIFVLEEGRLVGQGTFPELKANHALFRQMAAAFLEVAGHAVPS